MKKRIKMLVIAFMTLAILTALLGIAMEAAKLLVGLYLANEALEQFESKKWGGVEILTVGGTYLALEIFTEDWRWIPFVFFFCGFVHWLITNRYRLLV